MSGGAVLLQLPQADRQSQFGTPYSVTGSIAEAMERERMENRHIVGNHSGSSLIHNSQFIIHNYFVPLRCKTKQQKIWKQKY
jgi:hypothetical protein